jgi:4-hydroxybenzoate polyprenyltransferase
MPPGDFFYQRMKRPISVVIWIVVALVGAGALGTIAFHRGEPLNATWFVVAAACCYLVAYRFHRRTFTDAG